MQQLTREKLKNNLGYILTVLLTLLVAFIIPLIEGSVYGDISLGFPKDTIGWIVWSVIKTLTVGANMGIFGLLQGQATDNVKDNENYKKAKELLYNNSNKEYVPRSLKKYNTQVWSKKGTTVMVSAICSTVIISNLLLNWNLVSFIATLVSLFSTVAWGLISMKDKEDYLTNEFLDYAKMINKKGVKKDGN